MLEWRIPTSGFKTLEVRLKPDATFGFETGQKHFTQSVESDDIDVGLGLLTDRLSRPAKEFRIAFQHGHTDSSMHAKTLAELALKVWGALVALFESDVTPLAIDASHAQLQVLAFAIVGIFVLIDGLQNAAATGFVLVTMPDETDTWSYMWQRQGEGMIKGVVQIGAGAALVFGREALARGWSRLRGQPAPDPADPGGGG